MGVICVSKQGIVMDAFDLMLNCGLCFCLFNLNFLPKMAVFQIETLFVTNFSGNPISSVDICFFFFSDSEQPCGKRYVHSIYYLTFSHCVKRFTNVLVKIFRQFF